MDKYPNTKTREFIIEEVKEEQDPEVEDVNDVPQEDPPKEDKESMIGKRTITYLNQNQQILKNIKLEFGHISVALTGANGYLGSHVLRELLILDYHVLAGVTRSSSNEDLEFIHRLQKDFPERLQYKRFDMTKIKDCEELVADAHVIIHCATSGRNTKKEPAINILYPEIEGVLNLLVSAQKFKIRRFLLMGSVSNIAAGKYKRIYNESHWAHPDNCDDYERAKLFVERTAWNFVEENGNSINLTVFCPGLLVGPLLRKETGSASIVFLRKLIDGNFNQLLDLKMPVVDVRDVAQVVVRSIEKAESFEQRYLLVEGVYGLDQMYKTIQHDRRPDSYKSIGFLSKFYVRFLAFFDKDLKKIIQFYGKNFKFENEKSRRELQMEYRPFDQSLGSMIVSLEKYNLVEYSNNGVQVPNREKGNSIFEQ